MNNKNKILKNIIILTSVISLDVYASETSNSNHLNNFYFFGGGGKADFKKSDFSKSNDLTVLRYGLGYDFSMLTLESAYRGFSDDNDFTLRGIDIIARKNLLNWNDWHFSVGAGGYAYQSKLDNSIYSVQKINDISPLITLGAYYSLSDYVDIGLNYDQIFNVSYNSPKYDHKTKKNLDQWMLSLIIKPWANKDNNTKIKSDITEVSLDIPQTSVDYKKTNTYHYDSDKLTNDNKHRLDTILEDLMSADHYSITLTGNADSDKNHLTYNKKLAHRRAQSVMDYLLNHGIKKEDIQLKTKIYLLKAGEKSKPSERKVILKIKQETTNPVSH